MTTFPLATLACTIDVNGITAPPYADIFASLQASYKLIYGSDVDLDADTQDGQLLAVFASAINDCNAATIAAYNSFSPATAQGAGLSNVVKINGLARLVPTNSSVDLTLSGTAGTVITNGVVADAIGNRWALPATVTIGLGGTVVATAKCTVVGAATAAPATVTQIQNPTRGWLSATNVLAAVPGAPTEDDATLRGRQSVSTANPAQAINQGIIAAVANLAGVLSVKLYENSTGATDGNGILAHSICVVVEGGSSSAIAAAIASRKPPGTGTFGSTTVNVPDPGGPTIPIKFQRPTIVRILAEVDITALEGYVSTTGTALVAFLAAYVSSLPIGGDVYLTKATAAALLDNDPTLSPTYNVTLVKLSKSPASPAAADVVIAFAELADLQIADVTLITS